MIDGHMYSVGPESNILEANQIIDLKLSCERSDKQKILFLGSLSPFSNLYMTNFQLNNTLYNCVEQYIQSEKASLFNDDTTHAKIMKEKNPYKIKKLGSKVRNFNFDTWRKNSKQIALQGNIAKFNQNNTLKGILLGTHEKMIVESSADVFWGSGLHLHHKHALKCEHWKNKDGGAMCEILGKVHHDILNRKFN